MKKDSNSFELSLNIGRATQRRQLFSYANYFTILFIVALLGDPSVLTAQITGTVFRDFNADGTKQATNPIEPGLSGLVVTAFNAAGTSLGTATTSVTGAYAFAVGTLASGTKVRLEFTLPAAYFASNGATANSTVQFVTAGTGVTANLGVNAPADYCQANPNLVTPCYVNGDPEQIGSASGDPVLIKFPFTASGQAYNGGTPDVALATGGQIGAVWALAYQKNTKQLFSAAFLKRHVGFGPLGIGGIYKTNISTGATTNFIDVKTIGIDVGTDPHTGLTGNAATPSFDEVSFGKIGKIGMGGMDISDDGSNLFVVNLNLRTLNKINIDNPSVTPTAANVTTYSIPSPGCRNGNYRPFAVKYYRGKVYVGVVCSNETAQDTVGMNATVYEFDPIAATFTVVLQYPLTFRKGQTDDNPLPQINYWYAWTDDINKAFDYGFGQFYKYYPQYMLSDIEFDVDGTMIVSGMDRFGHQLGWYNYLPDPTHTNTQPYETTGNAQVYRASKCSGTTFTLENNASVCGAAATLGANNNKGPGGGSFYYENTYEPYHQELSYGGLALLPGTNEILETCLDPLNVYAGGVLHMNNSTGARGTAYEIYASPNAGGAAPFGKANGLGDLKILCDAQPIEIGNIVWNDANKNGIQDAGEAGISGVIVELYNGATKVGTATTTASGNFYFNTTNVNLNGATGILANTAYTLKIASTQFSNTGVSGGPLSNLTPTTANAPSTGLIDVADNDATVVGGLATISYTTGNYGENNHNLDFGFATPICAMTLTTNVSGCYDSNGNIAGGSSVATLQATVYWVNNPSGETINVSCTGAATQSINPATTSSPAIVNFTVPTDGNAATITATFSTSTTCTTTQNVAVPLANCILTPCCPIVLNPSQTFTNTNTAYFASQTDCNTTLTKTFNVSGLTGTLYDINVGLLLAHTFRGDVKIQLTSPVGTTVTIANQSNDNNDHYDLLLDDNGAGGLNNGTNQDTLAPNYAADHSAKPSNPLATFNSEDPNGTWTLTFCNTNFSTSGGRVLTFKGAILDILTKQASNCGANTGGTVWRDFNNNGVKDSNENEGVAAVTVKAFDCNGNLVETVTTDYLGQYTFSNVTPSVSNPIRLEFSNIPSPYKPSAAGADNGTDVRFITSPNCSYNLGVNNPIDYCQPNPSLTINCYVSGAYNSSSGTGHTLVGVPYNITQDPDGNTNGTTAGAAVSPNPAVYTPARPTPTAIADHNQIASTWGLAYDRNQRNLFAAAYVKAGTSLGPNGESTGKIFKINNPLSTAIVSDYVDLNTVFGAGTAGTNPHLIATTSFNGLDDAPTNAMIGKVGLGDMAISNDNAFLYVVNLADRQLYKIPTSGALNSTTITRYPIPTSGLPTVTDAIGTAGTCPNGDMRPFGLGVHPDGSIYVGGVCSGESISAGVNAVNNPASYQLTAYVWKFDGTAFTLQLNESLRFDRDGGNGYTTFDDFSMSSPRQNDWEPWHDLSNPSTYNVGNPAQNEPMLADISFDEKGDMFLGMRDRLGDCVTLNGGFLSSGDIYKTAKTATGWAFEKNATCGPNTTGGANNKQGPNGGEFFYQDIQGDGIPNSGTGGTFNLMGQYQVVSTTIDAVYLNSAGGTIFNPSAGGLQVYGTQDGALKGAFNLYERNDINTFAKAAGVGAIAALCDPAPLQIGNYVWIDTDKDGVQDPCERPLSNVTLSLWKNGVQIATTTTNANGNYAFTGIGAPNETWIATSGTDSILPNMAYEIRISTTQTNITTPNYGLTTANSTVSNGSDQNDSDAALIGTDAVIAFTTGAAGSTNHTLDFGFVPICVPPTITTVAAETVTCTNGVANTNAAVAIRGIAGMTKYGYNTTGGTGLFALNATASTLDSIRVGSLANPSVSTTYTFRMWGVDTTCYNDTTVVLNPIVCAVCSIMATFTQGSCNNNGTTAISADDYFTVTVSGVSSTNGGTSGKYEVLLNGSVLNMGGTAYGTSVTVGGILYFKSDGATTYNLTVRDFDISACTAAFTTTPSVSCSAVGCKPMICLPVTITKF